MKHPTRHRGDVHDCVDDPKVEAGVGPDSGFRGLGGGTGRGEEHHRDRPEHVIWRGT